MNHVDKNPLGWAKDTILTTEIIKSLLSTDQRDFVYAISVNRTENTPPPLWEMNILLPSAVTSYESRIWSLFPIM